MMVMVFTVIMMPKRDISLQRNYSFAERIQDEIEANKHVTLEAYSEPCQTSKIWRFS